MRSRSPVEPRIPPLPSPPSWSRALTPFELFNIATRITTANAVMTPAVFKNLVLVIAGFLNLFHELTEIGPVTADDVRLLRAW